MLRADGGVQHALRLVRGVGQDLLGFLGQGQLGGRRDALHEDPLALDLAPDRLRLDLEALEELVDRLLALAQDAEQDVLRLDHPTAQLAGLVAREEQRSARLFVVLFEHRQGSGSEASGLGISGLPPSKGHLRDAAV
jgi:hypothetical protein